MRKRENRETKPVKKQLLLRRSRGTRARVASSINGGDFVIYGVFLNQFR